MLSLLLGTVIVLALILVVRGLTLGSLQPEVSPLERLPVDPQAAAKRLVDAVRIQTVSYEDPTKVDTAAFPASARSARGALPGAGPRAARGARLG